MINFKILKKSKKSGARLGILETGHGAIETPCLVPVATQAVIKTLTSEEAVAAKCQLAICNTYHLHLRPGEKIIKSGGGLHNFMNWQKPLMTDSGGFQVFSLGFGRDFNIEKTLKGKQPHLQKVKCGHQPKQLKISDDGVFFTSIIDGRKFFMGPKESIRIQEALGADIMFSFDECPPPNSDYNYAKRAMKRTHRWEKMCLETRKTKQSLYGIVHGGKFRDLRIESAKFVAGLPFDGFGIGGDMGDNRKEMLKMLVWVNPILPQNKPRHLLGIGYLEDIPEIIKMGIDTFDCIVPTHYARHGIAFVSAATRGVAYEKLDMAKVIFLRDKNPLDKKCGCFVCQNYRRNYISHLFRAKEITALKLLTFHNLYFFNSYIEKIRQKIKDGII